MKQIPDYKQLTTAELCRIIADVLEVLNQRIEDPVEREKWADVMLAKALARGSEPYWMHDIRLAQRHIDTKRGLRPDHSGRASE